MTFLPEGYEVPKSSGGGYMKFKPGANKFRILSAPVMGWEYWTESKKPVRAKERWSIIPVDADISGKNGWNPKHFWVRRVELRHQASRDFRDYPDDHSNRDGRAYPFR